MTALGLALRWMHLAAGVLLVGAFSTLLLAGRSDRPTARRWESRLVIYARCLVLVALLTGVGLHLHQTAQLEGRSSAALDLEAIARVALDTQAGLVWLARQSLVLVLEALLLVRTDLRRSADWTAMRGQSMLLGAVAVALVGLAGHAAAVTPGTAAAVGIDVVHLVGAGVWAGGLIPLAMLLAVASRDGGADARPYGVLAARRFSRLALGAMLALLASGVVNTIVEVGSVPGLVGTAHGRLLLAKLVLVAAVLGLATVNRTRMLPALSGPAETIGRPAMRRLATSVTTEALLALAVLALVAAMTTTAPARHQQPTWPLSFRLTLTATDDAAGLRGRAIVASQVAVLGLVAIAASLALGRRRRPVLGAGIALLALGAGVALPSLVVEAYPTTYRRPAVPYLATSIASGESLYAEHCARCHGPAFPTGRSERRTAGDLFWRISRGAPERGMAPFADRLDESARWDLVNFLRALGAADRARSLGPTVPVERPWLVAPDFSFSVGPAPARALRDERGRRVVLLVLYTLPGSHARLAQLAERAQLVTMLEVEVIAVPMDASPDAIRQLGDTPPILFSVVTDGAAEIVRTYRLLAPGAEHAEFLIDRQGYIRARWTAAANQTRDLNLLLAEIQQLHQEKVAVAIPAEHVH